MKTVFIKMIINLSLILVLSLWIAAGFAGARTFYEDEAKTVLLLNSYHKGLDWTDEQTESIIEKFKHSEKEIMLDIEYFDWKNYPSKENLSNIYTNLKFKYSAKKIDLIMTTDDIALEFALDYRDEIFSSAPIVFSGINEESIKTLLKDKKNVTGIIEEVIPDQTIQMALEINPDLSDIYVFYDNTESGFSTGMLTVNTIKKLAPLLNITLFNDKSYEEIIEAVEQANQNTVMLVVSYSMDSTGRTIDLEDFCNLIGQHSAVPVFCLFDFGIDRGALGGNVLSGELQGENAAGLAMKILNGYGAEDLDILRVNTTHNIFDYNQLKRFHIPLDKLPEDSEIINEPFSFIETYKGLVITVLLILCLLILFISVLLLHIYRIRKIKEELTDSNQELSQLYEELTASEEELRAGFNELCEVKEELQTSEERYRLVVESSNDAIIDWNIAEKNAFFSDRWLELTGYETEELCAMDSLEQIIHPEDHSIASNIINNKNTDGQFICNYRIKTKDGEYKWFLVRGRTLFDSSGNACRLVGAHTIIHELIQSQEKLHHLAYYDSLTGLPNKLSLSESVEKLINGDERERKAAVFFIDIDNFKLINDSMGHIFGDRFINEIGLRLTQTIKDELVFRISGDEFSVFLTDLSNEEIIGLAETILKAMKAPFTINGSLLHTSLSIGIALYPEHGRTTDRLLVNADIAMYKAKELGKATYVVFNSEMNTNIIERMEIEKHLHSALGKDEIKLHYQPQVDTNTGIITGFEALLRWESPVMGMVSPLKFIPSAEDSKLIIPLGEWVLRQSCAFIKRVHQKGYNECTISVNISILQLIEDDFYNMVTGTLKEFDLSPESLELEITESVFMESFEIIKKRLVQMRNEGIQIALDDFGKGYSSLSYLKVLPITTLKIDREFISGITIQKDRTLTGDIITMGHRIKLNVVAEGVEIKEQYDYLKKHGCDKIQGFLFSRALPEENAIELLEKGHEWEVEF